MQIMTDSISLFFMKMWGHVAVFLVNLPNKGFQTIVCLSFGYARHFSAVRIEPWHKIIVGRIEKQIWPYVAKLDSSSETQNNPMTLCSCICPNVSYFYGALDPMNEFAVRLA